jgi:hypothetical protein
MRLVRREKTRARQLLPEVSKSTEVTRTTAPLLMALPEAARPSPDVIEAAKELDKH